MPERVEVALYWPEAMLRALQLEAARQDRSISWLFERAWQWSREASVQFEGKDGETPEGPLSGGDKKRHALFLTPGIRQELSTIACDLDRSLSFVAQRVVAAAWSSIAAA